MNPRRTFAGSRCLVTGAATGAGRAIAGRLADEGARILLTDRSLEQLEATARSLVDRGLDAASILAVDADLDEIEGRNKVIHAAACRFGALDLAANAAPICRPGGFQAQAQDAREVDVLSLIELTRALRPLLERGRGPTLMIFRPTEDQREISGRSDCRIARFTDAIRSEWSSLGIQVLPIHPGPAEDDVEKAADRLAIRALDEIRGRETEVSPAREGRLMRLVRRIAPQLGQFRFAGRIARGDGPDHEGSPVISSQASRLPRPHFGLRIKQLAKKGD